MEQPVVNRDESAHEQTVLNGLNLDFRIPGLPHSVVKHAQSTSVRQLIEKIENHPNRHALQQDLRQNQALSAFSPESKQTEPSLQPVQTRIKEMIQDVCNIELCELRETQCQACLSYWHIGIVYCTCGHFLHKDTVQSETR